MFLPAQVIDSIIDLGVPCLCKNLTSFKKFFQKELSVLSLVRKSGKFSERET